MKASGQLSLLLALLLCVSSAASARGQTPAPKPQAASTPDAQERRGPGVTETTVRVGTILPSSGPLAETGAAMRDVLAAYFGELNSKGGVYGRLVELRFAASGGDAPATAASAKALLKTEDLFAFVGGLSAGADKELSALAREESIPFVGASTLQPSAGRFVFYLLPGVEEQARALVNFAASRPALQKARAVVVAQDGELQRAASDACEEKLKRAGFAQVTRETYARGAFDAASLARKLKAGGVELVFFFGGGGDDAAFVRESAVAGFAPSIFTLGVLTGNDLLGSVTPAFKDRLFLAFPTVPADVKPEGEAELRALSAKYKFAIRHRVAQISALAAAKTFAEGLKRAGRDLSREKLVTALEGLSDFETGVTPPISFGPNVRVGASGAYVVTANPETKAYEAVGGWVESR